MYLVAFCTYMYMYCKVCSCTPIHVRYCTKSKLSHLKRFFEVSTGHVLELLNSVLCDRVSTHAQHQQRHVRVHLTALQQEPHDVATKRLVKRDLETEKNEVEMQ